MLRRPPTRLLACLLALAVLASGCERIYTHHLADDARGGRAAGTAGNQDARESIVRELRQFATGPVPDATGDDAYQLPFQINNGAGTNVFGMIEGTDLADEVVVIGAHYDGLADCRQVESAASDVCNGATDNAAGVGAVLEVARRISAGEERPRRSILFAFWDAEEVGRLGSIHYAAYPLVPLDRTVVYLNADILGSNLLPSLRRTTFAVGASTGGPALVDLVDEVAGANYLDVKVVSELFGQGASDHRAFVNRGVPIVWLSDSAGPCYHTSGDEVGVVDFGKLHNQTNLLHELTTRLAAGEVQRSYRPTGVEYRDAVELLDVLERARADEGRFSASARRDIEAARAALTQVVAGGPDGFSTDQLLAGGLQLLFAMGHMSSLPCDGYLR